MTDAGDLIQYWSEQIRQQIQAYADEHSISFKEAESQCSLWVNGQKCEPVSAEDITINFPAE